MQHPGGVQEVVAVLTERKGHFAERLSSLMHHGTKEGKGSKTILKFSFVTTEAMPPSSGMRGL